MSEEHATPTPQGIDYETCRVTVDMDAPTFELVYEVLQSFVAQIDGLEENPMITRDVPARLFDQRDAIKRLGFTFQNDTQE